MTNKPTQQYRVYYRADMWPQSIPYYNEMLRMSAKDYPTLIKPNDVVAYRNGEFWWAREIAPLRAAFHRWMNEWSTNEPARNELQKRFRDIPSNVRNHIGAIPRMCTDETHPSLLLEWYNAAIACGLELVIFAEYTIDVFDDHFPEFFLQWIKTQWKDLTILKQSAALLTPATRSESSNYRLRLLKFATKQLRQETPDTIAHDFCWLQMSWDGSNEITADDVKSELKKIKKMSAEAITEELQSINSYGQCIATERLKLWQQYALPEEPLETYWWLLDQFTVFHDIRKEVQMRCTQVITRVLKALSKQSSVPIDDLRWYHVAEVRQLLQGKAAVGAGVISERRSGMVLELHNDQYSEYYGQRANEKINRWILPLTKGEQTDEVHGMSASKGEVTGRAVVAMSAAAANTQVNEGDILISHMTTVDFLPAMRRAGGIITDDGGATCHAAVVARELGKPCIVGTKHATQVFHTNDAILLNANEGVAKRI